MVLENYQQETLERVELLRSSEELTQAVASGEDRYKALSALVTADVCAMMASEFTPSQSAQKISDWHRYVREQCSRKYVGEQGLPIPLEELNAFRLGLRGAMRYFYDLSSKPIIKKTGQVLHAINRHTIEVDW